jgi:hypothetical protein
MHSFLKQSTAAQSRSIGPFLDDTDFKTAETGLTIANTDIKLMINGAASADKNSGGGTHRANGVYGITFDATDTATVGEIFVSVKVAGALPVFATFVVVEEAVYDMWYAASALGYIANAPVNVAQISGDSTAADNLETAFDDTAGSVPWQAIVDQGTAQSATGTTLVLRAGAAFANDELNGATIIITGGTGAGQSRLITDYVGATDTATVDTWATTPSGTITYKIVGTATGSAGSGATAQEVWEYATRTLTALDEDVTTIDLNNTAVGSVAGAVGSVTGNVGGNVAGSVGSVTGAVGSVTGNVGGNVTGSVGSVTGLTASDVAAIKAKTDSLTFTVASMLDVNTLRINGVTVIGAGTSGDKWRA